MMREPLYQEWGHKLIPSSYGQLNEKKRYYRVFMGQFIGTHRIQGTFTRLVPYLFSMEQQKTLTKQEEKEK